MLGRAAAAPAAGVHGFNNNARAKSASSACASFTKGVNAVRSIFSTACSCIETPITYQVSVPPAGRLHRVFLAYKVS